MRWPDADVFFPAVARDDGIRPPLFSSLATKLLGRKTERPALPAIKTTEPDWPVIAATSRSTYASLDLRAPPDFRSKPENALHLLRALGTSESPVALEILCQEGRVHFQITASESDLPHIHANIEGFYPEIALIPGPDRLQESWQESSPSLVVDFALSEEFFLPLASIQSFTIDPYIALVSALSQATEPGSACLQILFEKTRNPWRKAILDAVGGFDGSGIFDNAPHFLKLADEKTRHPLYAVAIRMGAKAHSTLLAKRLASRVEGFVSQFANPQGNALIPLSNEDYPADIHEEAFLSRQSHRAGMLLSLEELCGFVHVPDASLRQPIVVREATRAKPPPTNCESGSLLLGHNEYRGIQRAVYLTDEERLAHMHVIGAPGTGKSTWLMHAALADIDAGRGTVVLDPHGDLIDDLLARLPKNRHRDVILFDPSDQIAPVGLNPLSAQSDDEREHLASDVVGIFERLATSWGDSMGSVLSNAVLAIVESEQGGTLLDLRRFLLDETFRRSILASVADEEVHFFWEKGYRHIGTRSIGPILTRLDAFLRSKMLRRIIDVRNSTFNWESVLDGQHIFLGKLSFGLLGEANASLLGSLIVSQLHQAALRRQGTAKSDRHPAFIYVDEFQHFTTPSLASLLSEGRKYGVGLVLAHQNLAQISHSPVESAVLGNTYTRMVFRVGEGDAGKLSNGYSFFEGSDFLSLGRGEALVRLGTAERVCNIATIAPSVLDPAKSEQQQLAIARSSQMRFGRKVKSTDADALSDPLPPVEDSALPDLISEPVSTASDYGEAFLPVAVPRGRLRGEEHRRIADIIARLGQERGFLATLEKPVAGGRVDVALERTGLAVACEVSVSTEVPHELGNAAKCIKHGFHHVLLVSNDEGKRERLRVGSNTPEFAVVKVVSLEELATFLDSLLPPDPPPGQIIRGYKVKINRKAQSPDDQNSARAKIGRAFTKPKDS